MGSRKVTRSYIVSLLQSEDLAVNERLIEVCLEGWRQAEQDIEPLARARKLHKAVDRGHAWAIGYCAYAYGGYGTKEGDDEGG